MEIHPGDILVWIFQKNAKQSLSYHDTCKGKSPLFASPPFVSVLSPHCSSPRLIVYDHNLLSEFDALHLTKVYTTGGVMELFVSPPLPRTQRTRRRTFPTCRRATWRDVVNTTPAAELRKNSLVVPRHLWDPRMRRAGVYRSVEYIVEGLSLGEEEIDSTYDITPKRRREIVASLRPLNTLLPRYERNWPVDVALGDAVLWSYKRDLLRCTVVTIAMSVSFLTIGVLGPSVLGIYSIPSVSMEPSLHVGDALLVEKVSLKATPPHRGEIVLFRPPTRLARMLTRDTPSSTRFLRRNDLFVKRVVATPGDMIEILRNGVVVNGVKVDKAAPNSPYVAPRKIPKGFVFVVGDNPDQSLDSRYWGLLPVDCVVGRPVARIFPLDRMDFRV